MTAEEAIPAPDRSVLENSQPLPWNRTTAAAGWSAGLASLVASLEASQGRQRALRSADRNRLQETLGSMLLGLYALRMADPERWGA